MQDISLEKHGDNEEFIESFLNLSIMTISVVCKDIIVEELDQKNISFFWKISSRIKAPYYMVGII
ncbi:hypothetical protein ACA804_000410 [Listeria monocytogenes]|nr:hypothetical protein [Listeria monocytogenes]EHT7656929.1 hypothetical protein [Listeria monocytogenes]EHW1481036.1 hypothetical protein [Listeria monocytogenes]EIA7078960.1 hypothetical protein [Listeria monocytogenes]EIA7184593.1 hypothetical protein [Listeria monocytogenes]